MKLNILGTRGSVPVSGKEFTDFGGGTSSLLVTTDEDPSVEIYLDAGSGIQSASPHPGSRITILFSHMHLDHLIGLPFFSALSDKGRHIDLKAVPRDGLALDEALERLFSPPYWPCRIVDYPADVHISQLEEHMDIGPVRIDTLEVTHPGGSTAFRLTQAGHSFVYATDYEHGDSCFDALTDFARDTDLLIYDGQYTSEEYAARKGFGHSIPEIGLTLAEKARVRKLLFTHFDPGHDDTYLSRWEEDIQKKCPAAAFARAGQILDL